MQKINQEILVFTLMLKKFRLYLILATPVPSWSTNRLWKISNVSRREWMRKNCHSK